MSFGPETNAAVLAAADHAALPYGAVMATAGASTLAARCGLHLLVAPLLTLAVAQALWVPAVIAWRHRRAWRSACVAGCTISSAQRYAGACTVPLGLAVITGGVVGLGARNAGGWWAAFAWTCFGLAWICTMLCTARFAWSLARRRTILRQVDGTWFLVPAAWLGAGIASIAVARGVPGRAAMVLQTLAFVVVLASWLGYWAVAGLAAVRVRYLGLSGVAQAPWWIAMGCAGLAAAALGVIVQAPVVDAWQRTCLTHAMTATVVVAIVLCVPVLAWSIVFLLRRCRFRASAAWPPTFSTAVFALGCLEAGVVLPSADLHALGLAAAYVTLTFWVVTFAWNTGCACVSRFPYLPLKLRQPRG